jgi:cation diffusion facilitator CzcD-associated flavoprotein CzcO
VIGAGPCGLAIARQLAHQQNVTATILDRAGAPAATWRTRYDGFRLNTCGFWSHLPGQRIPLAAGRWPTRDDMVAYFDDYARRQELRPQFGVTVTRVDRRGDLWELTTDGETRTAAALVVATGNYHTPDLPPWPGMEGFTGDVVHSADYRSAKRFAGLDVLVVGSGNSATDIVLQLCDAGARNVAMAVRATPHLVPRSAAGIPVDAFSPAFSHLPVQVLDKAAAVMQRMWFGDLSDHGLPAPQDGIYTALLSDGRIPTIGDQLVRRIKDGRIRVVAAVESFDADCVLLADGTSVRPDVVIAATGYRRGLEPMVGHLGVLDAEGKPVSNGLPSAAPGLWFAGYDEPLIGPLKSFRRLASLLAADVARYLSTV